MAILIEQDFGTPSVQSDKTVNLVIDGQSITAPAGASVMNASETAGINIPKLCATDTLAAFGSCRLCLIEIDGRRGTPASCTTPVEDGMVIHTQSAQLTKIRQGMIELYLSDTKDDPSLLALAAELGAPENRFSACTDKGELDESNPYFTFDPAACIVCSRCVRACDEVQGTFALTIEGRGYGSKVVAGMAEGFFDSECVSCGACVQACPTDALVEKTVLEKGEPDRTVLTTCAYCGVGCSFKAELKDDELIRMVPYKDGKANHGHSCVKGRFAYTYATHEDRITKPMIRTHMDDPWQEVSWDEAFEFAARRLKETQKRYGIKSIGGITSSRCTNEEVWAVIKLIRAGFGNNNVDTCARVCHSPTGYGLMQTFGESAGTQNFDSVLQADTILIIGSNPTDAHPVFGSQMKRRLRQGAKLIIADPRAIDLVRTPHFEADVHLALKPGTNVALINAIAHVIVKENWHDQQFIAARCDQDLLAEWLTFIADPVNAPETVSGITGIPAEDIISAARLYGQAGNAAIYYGLGVTEHSQGSTMVMGMANLAMITGNIGRAGVGVNPMRGQNNVQGSCDMGSFPHQLSGYRSVSDDITRGTFEDKWGCKLDPEPGFKIPNMFNEAVAGNYKGMYIQGEDVAQSDPNIHHVEAALRNLDILIVQDLFLTETARFAHVFLPGTSFLEKDGTFINAERRINRVRPVMPSATGKDEWQVTQGLGQAMGYDMGHQSASDIWDEIAALTPAFTNVSFAELDRRGSVQWPFNDAHPDGTEIMHEHEFVCGKGKFIITEYVPTDEKTNRRFPLILTTGRILSQYNVGAQTRRTHNNQWASEDFLQIHPADADTYGISDGAWVGIVSRKGETALRAKITERMIPGVVYTTFHHPESGANIVTTENSDWATECPEYKVTAVRVSPTNHKSDWQQAHDASSQSSRQILAGLPE
ncbi:MAG: formate dehydrogenase subunit alpha [Robiginitomaculum sp.]|nr:MAG: formate dehydrogenase subunit alpha [Robiginitomaculum sp.]